MNLLVSFRRENGRYPTRAEIAREMGVEQRPVERLLDGLEDMGALQLTSELRIMPLWSDERIALGGLEQRMLWKE